MVKERIQTNTFFKYMKPENVALITSMGKDKKTNIMTATWVMPVSVKPPLIAVAIKPSRHTHSLIKESEEFVINYLPVQKANVALACGTKSGREMDKIRENSLTKEPSEQILTPRIQEAYVTIECRLNSSMKTGDHTLFIGEVVNVKAEQGLMVDNALDLKQFQPIMHLGERTFCTTSDFVMKPKI